MHVHAHTHVRTCSLLAGRNLPISGTTWAKHPAANLKASQDPGWGLFLAGGAAVAAACHMASGGSQPCATTRQAWSSEGLSGAHVSWTLLSILLAERGEDSLASPVAVPQVQKEARGTW